MPEGKYIPSGVLMGPDAWWISGGQVSLARQKSSYIYSSQSFGNGPELKTPVDEHCSVASQFNVAF